MSQVWRRGRAAKAPRRQERREAKRLHSPSPGALAPWRLSPLRPRLCTCYRRRGRMSSFLEAQSHDALQRTLGAHRAAMAHRLGRLRILAVVAVLLLSLALWKGFGLRDWASNVAVFGSYLPVSVAIYFAGVRWLPFAQRAGMAVAFADVPVVWL